MSKAAYQRMRRAAIKAGTWQGISTGKKGNASRVVEWEKELLTKVISRINERGEIPPSLVSHRVTGGYSKVASYNQLFEAVDNWRKRNNTR